MKKFLAVLLTLSFIAPTMFAYDDRDDVWWNQNSSFKSQKAEIKDVAPSKPIVLEKEKSNGQEGLLAFYGLCVALLGVMCVVQEDRTTRFVQNFVRLNAVAGGAFLFYHYYFGKVIKKK